jgi:hypothetical protein
MRYAGITQGAPVSRVTNARLAWWKQALKPGDDVPTGYSSASGCRKADLASGVRHALILDADQ